MKATIIAEIASNWEGNLTTAKRLILKSKQAGADYVKFQMWRAADLYSRNHPQWSNIKKSELTFYKAKKLKNYADDIGIEFFCSVFYPEAVEFLESINIKRYKVASRTCLLKDPYSLETLEQEANTKKPIIISMGMGGNKNKIKKIFKKNKIIFCYCVSKYPTSFNEIDWNQAVNYNGFSDHSLGITAAIIFAVLKRQKHAKEILIEKHVKLENSHGPDATTSISVEELSNLISHIRTIQKAKIPFKP